MEVVAFVKMTRKEHASPNIRNMRCIATMDRGGAKFDCGEDSGEYSVDYSTFWLPHVCAWNYSRRKKGSFFAEQ